MRRANLPKAARGPIIVGLTLVSIGLPAYSSIGFDVSESRVWTTEQAYRWIRRELPKGTSIRFEGSITVRLPPEYNASYMKELHTQDVGRYKADGIQYLVASSQVYGRYQLDPADYPDENRRYQELFGETEEVARFTGSDDHPGPELRILRLK